MPDLNKVYLMGRLTFDPELRRTPNGTAVSELRMATSREFKGRDGETKKDTLFVNIVVWDRYADNCCQYLRKGSAIHVEGSLKLESWEDKNTGEKRSQIKVQAERVQFLDGKQSNDEERPARQERAPSRAPERQAIAAAPVADVPDDESDGIPFRQRISGLLDRAIQWTRGHRRHPQPI
jgi:single-strand DNA-binding protein